MGGFFFLLIKKKRNTCVFLLCQPIISTWIFIVLYLYSQETCKQLFKMNRIVLIFFRLRFAGVFFFYRFVYYWQSGSAEGVESSAFSGNRVISKREIELAGELSFWNKRFTFEKRAKKKRTAKKKKKKEKKAKQNNPLQKIINWLKRYNNQNSRY